MAAIITMVSFGIGLQQNIVGQAFARLDAFTAITVIGADANDLLVLNEGRTTLDEGDGDTENKSDKDATTGPTPNLEENSKRLRRARRMLNDKAIAEIQKLDGVRFAAPIVSFTSYIRFNDRTRFQFIVGATAGSDPRFKTFLAGRGFVGDNSEEAVISENSIGAFTAEAFRKRRNIRGNPDSAGPFQAVPDKSDEERQRDAQAVIGFRAFSVTNQLEEIERIFLIINSSLALLGGIALMVASFGISNTMIMSIRERTREIGIMKAIGGSDGEIMRIFFVEASLIGLLGGVFGVIAGWAVDRIANVLANQWIARQAGQAVRHVEFFSIPWYLWGGAILFALLISLIPAIYPARRAAKVDPIKALRYE